MDNISKRRVVNSKVINKFHIRNIVFTIARFTLYDTEEKYEEFFENPNLIIKSCRIDSIWEESEDINNDFAAEEYISLRNRKYFYKIECYVLKEERSGTITDIDNIDFTISYKAFLNFLKDDPLRD